MIEAGTMDDRGRNDAGETMQKHGSAEEEMKRFGKYGLVLVFAVFMMILPGVVPSAIAQSSTPPPIVTNPPFIAGTTISSTKVNENFSALNDAVPRMTSVGTAANVVLTSQTQNLATVTVTPPGNGMMLLIASLSVTMAEGGTFGGKGWGTISANLCITPMNNCAPVMLDMPPLPGDPLPQLYSPRITFPATFMAMAPAVKGVPATYNLTGLKDYSDGGSIIVSGTLLAIFMQWGL